MHFFDNISDGFRDILETVLGKSLSGATFDLGQKRFDLGQNTFKIFVLTGNRE